MKRSSRNFKHEINPVKDEESRLSQILFTKKQKLIDKLKPNQELSDNIDLKPVWTDDDDGKYTAANVIPQAVSNVQYTEKLKQKYRTIVGTPSWAEIKKNTDCEDDDKLMKTVGHIVKKKTKELKKDFLEYKILPKINNDISKEGPLIKCIEFHPKMSVSLIAGQSGVVSLYSIGGDKNERLHSFNLKKWQITAAHFTPDGKSAFIASKSNHSYCIYDLVKAEAKLVQLPQISKRPHIFQLSPNGKYLATSDCFDEVYLIDTASQELIRVLKNSTNIKSAAFNSNSSELYCFGDQGIVTVWSLCTFKSLKKFYDNGCVTASCITTSACGRLIATGSGEGIVNIYKTSDLMTNEPIPLKTVSNITTKITSLKFNSTTEILAACSAYYPNAVKLIHIPSYHVYQNLPKQSFNYNHIQVVNFSPNSGYMAFSNNRGSAFLHRLKYYKNY